MTDIPPEGSAIVAEKLTKQYGKVTALDRIDLSIRVGEIFGLLGPNGAGKTTAIKLFTGLSDITSGRAFVAGFDVARDPLRVKERIGWVAAEVILDDDFTAMENLWMQAKLQSLSDWRGRALDLLKYFELDARKDDRVSQFSTGMRKKLEIALALLHQPTVVFMDEPTVGLDAGTRRMLWDLIRGVNREFGVTVLLTTHYMEEAETLCGRIAILDQGRVVAEGTPDELRSRVQVDLIEIETSPPLDPATVGRLPGVQSVTAQGKGWEIRVVNAEESLPVLLQNLPVESIRRITVQKPSLETVFLELTGRRLGGEGEPKVDFRRFYMQMRRQRG